MKKWNLFAMVFVLSTLFCLAASGAAYSGGKMIDLGTLGGENSEAKAINKSGQIVGWSITASGETHAFLKNPGQKMKDLGTLGGTGSLGIKYSIATGINDKGQVVGTSIIDFESGDSIYAPFLYSGDAMTVLNVPDLDAGAYTMKWWPNGINNSGEVVGAVEDPVTRIQKSFLYSEGAITILCEDSVATGINDNGDVVGWYIVPTMPLT
jgi:probable HAF family extracellular repeat protein